MAGARRTTEREAGAAERGARTWRAGAGARSRARTVHRSRRSNPVTPAFQVDLEV